MLHHIHSGTCDTEPIIMAAHTVLDTGVTWAHRQIDSENYIYMYKLTSRQNSATSMHSLTHSKPTEGIKTFRNIAQA